WLRDVKCIGRHTESHNFAENGQASGSRSIQWLQHQHGGAFAQNEAPAVLGEWTASVRRDHPHGLPGLQETQSEHSFAATRNRHLHRAVPDHPERLSDGMVGRRTSGGDGVGGTHYAGLKRNPAGCGILHRARNGEWIHSWDVIAVKVYEAFVLSGLPPDAGAGDDGRTFTQGRGPGDSRLSHRLACRDYSKLRETIQ